jgi:hypothetical protein
LCYVTESCRGVFVRFRAPLHQAGVRILFDHALPRQVVVPVNGQSTWLPTGNAISVGVGLCLLMQQAAQVRR